ncbi:hydroxyacid dehydrogenase [Ruania alba]|uniref:Phosphoglycerate dehydrogenase n=1 Tax=Ruania alba TaxID=648782 RepID=A0A1H5KT86_9MICO|nr:hydroxyacid dehydrogenase [Ruania alba]SEE67844.1 Phosphoglycerate dehydrogenase [Ruania alba]
MRTPVGSYLLDPSALETVFGPSEQQRLSDLLDIDDVHTTKESLLDSPRLSEVEVLVGGWGTPRLTPELLDRMPALRLVLYSAGSVRHLVTEEFWQRGIAVVSAADANNEPVAEYVLANTVLALTGEHRSSAHLRATHTFLPDHTGLGMYDRRIGLVGFGSIARKVADRLRRFGHHIGVWDPYLEARDAVGVHQYRTLTDLFAESDVVSIHAPWIPGENDKLVGAEALRALPRGATLINTARGALVDEEALVDLLREREDLYAVLDVTWPEPPPDGSPLYELGNVKLTGHIAGSIGTERRSLGRLVVGELERWLTDRPLEHQVTEAAARLRA